MTTAYGYTPKAMIDVAVRARDKLQTQLKRGNLPPTEVRYILGGLENIAEVLQFCADHEAAISKAARKNVPWRASTK
jgi:hypothetical protein